MRALLLAACFSAAANAAEPAATPSPARVRVSVSAWENTGIIADSPWLVDAGPDLIANQLAGQPELTVLERGQLEAIIDERELTGGAAQGGAARPTGAAAEYVVGGSYRIEQGRLAIDLRIVRTDGSAVRWSGQREVPLDDYAAATQALGRQCATWFAEMRGQAPVEDSTPARAAPLAAASAFYRGEALLRTGAAERAVADFLRAVHLAPGYAAAWRELGMALSACGRPAAADAAFAQATACDPDDPDAARALYDTANRLSRREPAAASRLFERIISEHPFSHMERWQQTIRGDISMLASRQLALMRAAPMEAAGPTISRTGPAAAPIGTATTIDSGIHPAPAAPASAPATVAVVSAPLPPRAHVAWWKTAAIAVGCGAVALVTVWFLLLRRRP